MSDTVVGFIVMTVLFLVLVAVLGLITMFAWNVGVVALVAACGGEVSRISFLAAVAINFAIGVVRRVFACSTPAAKNG